MRLLLDTHIFLWLLSGDPRLPLTMQEAIRDPENDVFLSPISLWEAIIKHQTGDNSPAINGGASMVLHQICIALQIFNSSSGDWLLRG
jgi:PIN domain nuclease of toxin-antitoxin system